MRQRGFTLLEILAALVITVIGIAAVVKVTGSAVDVAQTAEDCALASWVASNRVRMNVGGGSFSDSGQMLGADGSTSVALGDLNDEDHLDAFVVNNGPNRVWVNNGSGIFTQDSANSLGNLDSRAVALGDVNFDGELDAWVANELQGNRVWSNDSGTFMDSRNSLGVLGSRDIALGDLDNDGDLDGFVVNSSPNRVWLNQDELDDDGVPDTGDNGPTVDNPRQKNMNSDLRGNLCDPDTDGDSTLNVDDDDGDGVVDTQDGGVDSVSSLDPDRDHDGIYDKIDPQPDFFGNSDQCLGEATSI